MEVACFLLQIHGAKEMRYYLRDKRYKVVCCTRVINLFRYFGTYLGKGYECYLEQKFAADGNSGDRHLLLSLSS